MDLAFQLAVAATGLAGGGARVRDKQEHRAHSEHNERHLHDISRLVSHKKPRAVGAEASLREVVDENTERSEKRQSDGEDLDNRALGSLDHGLKQDGDAGTTKQDKHGHEDLVIQIGRFHYVSAAVPVSQLSQRGDVGRKGHECCH